MKHDLILIKTIKITALLTLFIMTSCVTDKRIFQIQRFANLEELKLKTVIKLESKCFINDITPNHLIEIGEGIYPNNNHYILATPKTYKLKERPNFEIEVEYFYAKSDSSVKVILYQWDSIKNHSKFYSEENSVKKFRAFQLKFNNLKDNLTKKLGEPIYINLEQNESPNGAFRDDVKWTNKNGLNAYLFMFGNNNGYRQIRLAIYKE